MSWKDEFSARGSFRGAGFWVRSSEFEPGRRVQVHEYPQRDKPYVEDLGRKARVYRIEAYCLGADYLQERDALIAAIEKPGAGTLKHPYYGNLQVTVTSYRVRESTREGGYASLELQVVEDGGQTFPTSTASTQDVVRDAADRSLSDAIDDFADVFTPITDVADAVDDFLLEVDRVFASVEHLTGSVAGAVADLVRAPAELGSSLAGTVSNLASIAGEPKRAIGIYDDLFDAGDSPSVHNTTPRATEAARNTQALNQLVRRAAVIEACRAAADLALSPQRQTDITLTRDAVATMREQLLFAIDDQQLAVDVVSGAPISDTVYVSLAELRKAVAVDLSGRGQRLPAVKRITPTATLPTLVLAHQQYGDATREGELVKLNNLRHPGFAPGGKPIEVLSG
ncbi:DNA circularization protein [Thiohalophilus sp.]|uniref:DNA circularization protein n=1 Tax=Thiohalophilus sp. TaxID=3028392 RepID=UPI002ACDDD0A|nr:DNA circularization N-terminal domain-containing protein [Thiohalophilus sp.]MDZ7804342.1 DNA circularization N-terminal domain-containing protein [Thiohalophilus sp.]